MNARIVYGRVTRYYLDGREVTREEFEAAFPPPTPSHETVRTSASHAGSSLVSFKPLHSEALAVHPRQIPEAIEDARTKGIPTEFDRVGRPVFTSSRHFRAYARKYGFRHKSY